MDVERIDAAVRSLPAGASRRGVLASVLGGALAILGQKSLASSARSAAKACKGKRGDKKKTCLEKAKARNRECRNDGDCADRSTSCQGGKCRLVCPEGACTGCTGCVANLRSENERAQVCALQIFPVAPDTCATDADCTGNEDDVCIRVSTAPCTQSPCGLCVAPITVCGQ